MPYKDPHDQTKYYARWRKSHASYQRDWMRQNRQSFFAGKACGFCGSTGSLQLHHLDPDRKESHRIWSWSKERRESEIAGCIVLCAACHRSLHHGQKRPDPQIMAVMLPQLAPVL